MFENVLVGVDGRTGGHDAIALAQTLASRDARLAFVNVRVGRTNPVHALARGVVDEERDASNRLLRHARAQAAVDAALVSVEAASPARGLHEEADARDADLIVVGSCARGAFGRVMLGDDASAALNGAPCAVAIASAGFHEKAGRLEKLGVAFNGTPESEAALELARGLARESGASILALEVVHLSAYTYGGLIAPPLMSDAIEAMLGQAAERMQSIAGADGRTRYGLAGEELAAFGDEVDLLIVGSRSYGPLRRLVTGSTASYLERHARCSLLVLPRGAKRRGGERLAAVPAGEAMTTRGASSPQERPWRAGATVTRSPRGSGYG
jgi:nucleotide-binding universal stress UspA family protein